MNDNDAKNKKPSPLNNAQNSTVVVATVAEQFVAGWLALDGRYPLDQLNDKQQLANYLADIDRQLALLPADEQLDDYAQFCKTKDIVDLTASIKANRDRLLALKQAVKNIQTYDEPQLLQVKQQIRQRLAKHSKESAAGLKADYDTCLSSASVFYRERLQGPLVKVLWLAGILQLPLKDLTLDVINEALARRQDALQCGAYLAKDSWLLASGYSAFPRQHQTALQALLAFRESAAPFLRNASDMRDLLATELDASTWRQLSQLGVSSLASVDESAFKVTYEKGLQHGARLQSAIKQQQQYESQQASHAANHVRYRTEADEAARGVLTVVQQRIGRYPQGKMPWDIEMDQQVFDACQEYAYALGMLGIPLRDAVQEKKGAPEKQVVPDYVTYEASRYFREVALLIHPDRAEESPAGEFITYHEDYWQKVCLLKGRLSAVTEHGGLPRFLPSNQQWLATYMEFFWQAGQAERETFELTFKKTCQLRKDKQETEQVRQEKERYKTAAEQQTARAEQQTARAEQQTARAEQQTARAEQQTARADALEAQLKKLLAERGANQSAASPSSLSASTVTLMPKPADRFATPTEQEEEKQPAPGPN